MKSMNVSCVDDRVVLARRGALSPSEWQEFATHLSSCADCRIAWRLGKDLDRSGTARPGDERIIARGTRRALGTTIRPRKNLARVAIAASVTLAAIGVASGAILLHTHRAEIDNAPDDHERATKLRRRSATKPRIVPAEAPSEQVSLPASTIAPIEPPISPHAGLSRRTHPSAPPPTIAPEETAAPDPFDDPSPPSLAPPPRREDAAGLFAEAVAERQQGRNQMAIAAFRGLQRRFPDSPEATVSLVSLGGLLLGEGSPAEALLAYETYLLRTPNRTLLPEAMVGKARALAELGRTSEAAATWREIARRFPDSPYARRALGARTEGKAP